MQEDIATPTPVPSLWEFRITVEEANVRGGPGTNYPIVDSIPEGTVVQAVARTGDGQWLELAPGRWLFALLVDDDVDSLPVARNIPVAPTPRPVSPATPVPATQTPVPTPTPTPKLGDAAQAVLVGSFFDAPDGLRLRVVQVLALDHPDIAKYLVGPIGSTCPGCLVVEIEIDNHNGNDKEYVMQDDFELWTDMPARGGQTAAEPVDCDNALARTFNASPQAGGSVRPNPIFFKRESVTRFLCFEGIEDNKETIRRNYLLAYSHQYVHVPVEPTPDPDRPTPTPTRDEGVIREPEPLESEQDYRLGWEIFFSLNSG